MNNPYQQQPQQQYNTPQQPAITPQQLIFEVDTFNEQYHREALKTTTNLVDLKVAIHKHDHVLDSKLEDFRSQVGTLSGNNEALRNENIHLAQFISSTGNKEVTV